MTHKDWIYAFWAYPSIYLDDDYMLHVRRIHDIMDSGVFDLRVTKYMIDNQPAFATDYDRAFRPTEVEAFHNLYQQAQQAEIRRYLFGKRE